MPYIAHVLPFTCPEKIEGTTTVKNDNFSSTFTVDGFPVCMNSIVDPDQTVASFEDK